MAPATYNRNLDTLRSAIGYWRDQDWLATDPSRALRRRSRATDRGRALDRAEIADLLARDDWQTGTARLLPRLLKGRTRGPVFLTDRRARLALAPADVYELPGWVPFGQRWSSSWWRLQVLCASEGAGVTAAAGL
ncbi:hypothetical protein ODJ79_02325 [Actinoplanes sp. KI2]|uniref:hypothetical protein n=1 Tax=Actinoplanes sp. KI2 TaxID=2983315 RepID=UPI0021D60AD0|nr:hypothetical protein [Actinoplanes sp. KI2]MCU7722542.1 hypothetical protein [Actinoplanes sp. KI2]